MRLALRPQLALVAVLAACSSDGPSEPAQADAPLDLAPLLAEMTLPNVPTVGVTLAATAPGAPDVPTNCPYDAASRSFVCPPVTRSGLTVNVAYTLLDAAGRPLATADRNTTASIRTVMTARGTIPFDERGDVAGTLTVDQRQELTLSGLLAGPHKLDGTGTIKLDGTVNLGFGPLPVRSTVTLAVAGLVPPAGGSGGATGSGARWPSAGTITVEATNASLGNATTTQRAELTFNGTSTVGLALTIGGVTRRCTVNLATTPALVCTG